MRKSSKEQLVRFEQVFKNYLDAYMIKRDLSLVEGMLRDDFCGYGTGLDESNYRKEEAVAIYRRDIASAPNPLHYTLNRFEIKLLDLYSAIVVGELDLQTRIMDQELKLNNLRMLMVLHEEDDSIKLCGLHISFPTQVHQGNESYPLKQLEERNELLKRMVEEKTKTLQQAINERREAEETLQESQKLLQGMFESIQDGVSILNPDLSIRQVNSTIKEWYRKELPLEGKKCFQAYHHKEEPCDFCPTTRCLETGRMEREEVRIPTEVGEKWKEIFSYPLIEPGTTTVTGAIEFVRDITERKETEKELHRSEEKYRMLSENASDVIWMTNMQLKYEYISPSAESLYGFSIKEMQSLPITDFLPLSSADLVRKILQEEIEKDKLPEKKMDRSRIVEYEHFCKDGSQTWVETKVSFLRDNEGRPTGVLGITRDISDRKQVEKDLNERNNFIDKILNSLPDIVVYIFDLTEEKNIYISKNLNKVLGYSLQEFQDMGNEVLPKLIHPDDLDRFNQHLQSFVKTKTNDIRLIEYRMKHRNGDWVWIENRDNLFIADDSGQPLQIIGSAIDITERKKAEVSLFQLQEETNESHRRLLTVLESIDTGIYVADIETYEVLYMNRYIQNIFGEIVGEKCWNAFQNDETGPCSFCNNYLLMDETGEPTGVHRHEVYNTKVKRWFDCRDRILRWVDGRLVRLEISTDITQQKEIEDKLAYYDGRQKELYRQLEEELNKAKRIHQQILPTDFPAIEGVSFAAHYQPAARIGGDFYDIVQVGKQVIIYLSDVSGHGLDSAMLSFFIKHTIKGFLSFSPPEKLTPGNILHYLTMQFKQENFSNEYFICIFIGVLDLTTMEISYSGAGFQDIPLVRMGNGEQRKLQSKGLFLSPLFSSDINFQEKKLVLTPGSTILFNTDGLTEEGRPGAFYGKRLPEVFYQNAHLPPKLVVHAVLNDFKEFNNGSLQGKDDITFMVMQAEPTEIKKKNLELKTDFAELKDARSRNGFS